MIELIAKENELTNRNLSILKINEVDTKIDLLNYKYFVLFLVDNINKINIDEMSLFIERLLQSGMIYLCAWGKNCELIHDLTDEIICSPENLDKFENEKDNDDLIQTTWHNDETLAEALWFSIYDASPAKKYFHETKDLLAITINDDASYYKIINYMRDLRNLKKIVYDKR